MIVIVALDFNNEQDAMRLVSVLNPRLCKLKIGSELFISCGIQFVEKLMISGFDVFVDLKLYDIPNTVECACAVLSSLDVWMISIHALGGVNMIQAAKQALSNCNTLLIAVTILTSFDQPALSQVMGECNLTERVLSLANLATQYGCDGVVCSAFEASHIKQQLDLITVTPGIRLDKDTHDQKRVLTSFEDIDMYSKYIDYMVVGRSITKSADPASTLLDILTRVNNND